MTATPVGITPAMLAPARTSDARRFGRVEPDGTVYLIRGTEEVRVGQWVAGTPEQGLTFYARRYDDLMVEIDLLARRLREGRGSTDDAQSLIAKTKSALETPDFVGDCEALTVRCDELSASIEARRVAAQAEKAARKAAAAARRTAIVVEAESLTDATNWKIAGDRLRDLLEEWKSAPHGDKGPEQALWKRFSAARSNFERRRKQHFSQVDAERKEATSAKESIIAEAEKLAASTDWVNGAKAFRTLVDRWKVAPRAQRSADDRLWARFKAAQDSFFDAKNAAATQAEEALRPNVEAKAALAAEAEALLPITDAKAAKAALRSIQSRWDAVGDVPRAERERVEGRLRKVEEALRALEADRWKKDNPEARARAEATVAQFQNSVDKISRELDNAKAKDNAAAVLKAETALASSQPLLDAAKRALEEFGG